MLLLLLLGVLTLLLGFETMYVSHFQTYIIMTIAQGPLLIVVINIIVISLEFIFER